ncbi:MAG: hypothetical protein CVV64_02635 [Candidatus Wallbacteria bacterium HGW-Wallbacteria-1]|jgi:LysM repeat protein|uniref:LysM domain-containing protein n=1 Tax=Candidatus Wallbacteria bacterium HGW-Wallbacteria-1 TaxID=2013854 RepID=A0A2N1PVG0_9BACT|nr:MAG: hypothetical protein CVV64_02635 [Candidatus Wallbacteria bacterium HGW-Wallbacteria-1]
MAAKRGFSNYKIFVSIAISSAFLLQICFAAVTTHSVVTGDTLSGIARKYYGNASLWPELQRYNSISNADLIYNGTQIKVPDRQTLQAMKDAPTTAAKKAIADSAKANNGTVPPANPATNPPATNSGTTTGSGNASSGLPPVTPTANNPRGVSYDALKGLDLDI